MLPNFELIDAIRNGQPTGFAKALAKGASPESCDFDGLSALAVAIKSGRVDLGRRLLELGADPNQTLGKQGDTLLHRAAKTGDYGFTRLLIEHGGNVNACNHKSATPLHFAATQNHAYVATALLNAGATVDSTLHNGDTPLHIAARNGHTDMIKVLLKGRADPVRTNNARYSAIDVAVAAGHTSATEMLAEHAAPGTCSGSILINEAREAVELQSNRDENSDFRSRVNANRRTAHSR